MVHDEPKQTNEHILKNMQVYECIQIHVHIMCICKFVFSGRQIYSQSVCPTPSRRVYKPHNISYCRRASPTAAAARSLGSGVSIVRFNKNTLIHQDLGFIKNQLKLFQIICELGGVLNCYCLWALGGGFCKLLSHHHHQHQQQRQK